jgi:hypothetical protein
MNLLELLLWPVTVAITLLYSIISSSSSNDAALLKAEPPPLAAAKQTRQSKYRQIMESNYPGSFDGMMARRVELERLAAVDNVPVARSNSVRRVRQVYRPPGSPAPDLNFFGQAEPAYI